MCSRGSFQNIYAFLFKKLANYPSPTEETGGLFPVGLTKFITSLQTKRWGFGPRGWSWYSIRGDFYKKEMRFNESWCLQRSLAKEQGVSILVHCSIRPMCLIFFFWRQWVEFVCLFYFLNFFYSYHP